MNFIMQIARNIIAIVSVQRSFNTEHIIIIQNYDKYIIRISSIAQAQLMSAYIQYHIRGNFLE